MIFRLSLYLFNILILSQSFASEVITDADKIASIQNLQLISPLLISEEIQEKYDFLAYGKGKQNHIQWFIKRAQLISQFLQNREGFKIPEYVVVVDGLIKYLNEFLFLTKQKSSNVHKNDEVYLLFMKIFKSLNSFIESVRADAENGYANLKYQDVINFTLKVSLFTKTYSLFIHDPDTEPDVVTFLREIEDEFKFRHLIEKTKIERFVVNKERYYRELPINHRQELSKIHNKDNIIKVDDNGYTTLLESFPTRHNYLDYPLYFILIGGGEHLDCEYFKSLPLSHFLHIPGSDHPNKSRSLYGHLKHDAIHALEYLEKILDINILKIITSNSPDKYLQIEAALLSSAIKQGAIWDGLEEFFGTDSAKSIGRDFNLKHFTDYFFTEQHENTNDERRINSGTVVFRNDYSPTAPQSLISFLKRFLMETQEKLSATGKNIDIESYVSDLESLVNKRIESYEEVHNNFY